MRIFIDTNVLADTMVKREDNGFSIDAVNLMSSFNDLPVTLYASAVSIPTLAYLIKGVAPEIKKYSIKKLLKVIDILPSHKKHVDAALNGNWHDIEDAMQYACAVENACDLIITRDVRDYRDSQIPVMTPSEFLAAITEPS